MRSTFMGLETSKRGLFTQQTALYTVGHNLDNANRLGYSRQRVNMQATSGFPGVGLHSGTMPGFLGTGVEAGSIQRIRDAFVDNQYRQETNKLGFWDSKSKAITQMEDVLSEPSAYGLQKALGEFWSSLQTVATNPENGGARAVAIRQGAAVADSFNYMHKSLKDIQTNLGKEITIRTGEVNSILEQIADINRQILQVEPNGYMPNDLYDTRDVLLDQLAEFFPIETEYVKSGGRALAIAEGAVTVKLKMGSGPDIILVQGKDHAQLRAEPNPLTETAPDGTIINKPSQGFTISLPGVPLDPNATSAPTHTFDKFLNEGTMKSLINSYGTSDGAGGAEGLYPDMLADLDKMAFAFAEEFNRIHKMGFPKNGPQDPLSENFFVTKDATQPFSAGNIKVNALIDADASLFRASTAQDEVGNSENALNLSKMQFTPLIDNASIQVYYQGVIGKLGVEGRHAGQLVTNTENLRDAIEFRRASISSVSPDEEMTDMIRFQQSYNASARMITVVDEMLDKIINGMGRVGL